MRFEFDFYGYDDETTGLSIEIDGNDYVDVTSLYGYGEYSGIEKRLKTLRDLKEFITDKIEEVEEPTEKWKYTRVEALEELLEFILTSQVADKVIDKIILSKQIHKAA